MNSIAPLFDPGLNRKDGISAANSAFDGAHQSFESDSLSSFQYTLDAHNQNSSANGRASNYSASQFSNNQSATDRVRLPVSAKFIEAIGRGNSDPFVSGIGTSSLTIQGTEPDPGGVVADSYLTFVSVATQTAYNEEEITVGRIEYHNGLGFHNLSKVRLELDFGPDSDKFTTWVNFQQPNPGDADQLVMPNEWFTANTLAGKSKAYNYGFVAAGQSTPGHSERSNFFWVDEGTTQRADIRMRFFGIDHNDEFSEAANFGFIHDQRRRASWIAHLHDTDMYRIQVAAEQRLAFDIDTVGMGLGNSTFRPRLSLYTSDGRRLRTMARGGMNPTKAPDETDLGFDPYFQYTFAEAGEFFVSVGNAFNHPPTNMDSENLEGLDDISLLKSFNYNPDQAIGRYDLIISDPDDQLVEAKNIGEIRFNAKSIDGRLFSGKDVDMYSFTVATHGQILAFDLDYGSDFLGRAQIALYKQNGQHLKFVKAFNGIASVATSRSTNLAPNENQNEPYLEFRFGGTGKYFIAVSARHNWLFDSVDGTNDINGGGKGSYRLQIVNLARVTSAGRNNWSGSLTIPNKIVGKSTITTQLYAVNPDRLIKPNVETWIIVHGRTDYPSSFEGLANNLQQYFDNQNYNRQVLLLDWRHGADDNQGSNGLQGSEWIPYVAKWVESALEVNLRITGPELSVIGHSWGSYAAYEIAHRVNGRQKALVALDPANAGGWAEFLGLHQPEYWRGINFSEVSQLSWTFFSNGLYGDSGLAQTAHESFMLFWPTSDNTSHDFKHKAPVELFETIVTSQVNSDSRYSWFSKRYFNLGRLLDGKRSSYLKQDAMTGNFDGMFRYFDGELLPRRFVYFDKRDNQRKSVAVKR